MCATDSPSSEENYAAARHRAGLIVRLARYLTKGGDIRVSRKGLYNPEVSASFSAANPGVYNADTHTALCVYNMQVREDEHTHVEKILAINEFLRDSKIFNSKERALEYTHVSAAPNFRSLDLAPLLNNIPAFDELDQFLSRRKLLGNVTKKIGIYAALEAGGVVAVKDGMDRAEAAIPNNESPDVGALEMGAGIMAMMVPPGIEGVRKVERMQDAVDRPFQMGGPMKTDDFNRLGESIISQMTGRDPGKSILNSPQI